MSILDQILGADSGKVVGQLSQRFGLDAGSATAALSSLVPALASGVQRNAAQPGGLEALLGALTKGNHGRHLDDPSSLGTPETTQDGNGILGHILGSKDASRAVAQQASAQSGISADLLKKLLPVAATLVMAHLAKRKAAGATAAPEATGGDAGGGLLGGLGGLGGMLDADKDGKVEISDVLGMAKKFL